MSRVLETVPAMKGLAEIDPGLAFLGRKEGRNHPHPPPAQFLELRSVIFSIIPTTRYEVQGKGVKSFLPARIALASCGCGLAFTAARGSIAGGLVLGILSLLCHFETIWRLYRGFDRSPALNSDIMTRYGSLQPFQWVYEIDLNSEL